MNSAHPPDSPRSHITDSVNLPETNNTHIPTYERDPAYYYPDGNIVFLASGVLFKVYAFLVLPVGSASSTTENTGKRYPLGVNDLPAVLTDSSDTYPIVLSDITAIQFRNYLFALFGRIYDPEYRSLFTDATNKEKHSQDLLVRLLDIADVSNQFGMDRLKEWAFSQLELVLESMYELANNRWERGTLLRLHSCARLSGRSRLVSSTANFIQYFISIWTAPEDTSIGGDHTLSNLDTCVQLFKDSNLPDDDPTWFGCAFVSILALGHRSATWTSKITRGQRAVLYAAQVQLTASNEKLPSTVWLVDPHLLQFVVWICSRCCDEFSRIWATSFKKYTNAEPANRLIALARLPQYRRSFSLGLDPEFAPHGDAPGPLHHSVSRFMGDERRKELFSRSHRLPPNLHGDSRPRDRIRCTESEWPLGYLDYHIRLIYRDLAERHKDIASEV